MIFFENNEHILLLHYYFILITNREFKMKITYIGAFGKIGRVALRDICSTETSQYLKNKEEELEIVLIGSDTAYSLERLSGCHKDVSGAIRLNEINGIKFVITDDYSKTAGSKVVICSAGKWPSMEEKEEFKKTDKTGRLCQSFANKKMIQDIFTKLDQYCQNAVALIVTNQVDMMCNVARKCSKKMRVYGLTGAVDSTRFIQASESIVGEQLKCYMTCYHNNDMLPIKSSIKCISTGETCNLDNETFDKVVNETKDIGRQISEGQAAGNKTGLDTGASELPGAAVARFVLAYCFGIREHIESYNTVISDEKTAKIYGVEIGDELSIPVEVKQDKILTYVDENVIQLDEREKEHVKEAIENMKTNLKLMYRRERKRKNAMLFSMDVAMEDIEKQISNKESLNI